ncbi:unannotated protein [freshwater metagenome]|uniref:Unannotated protein n=1 Tax=freshwater metagenome TaxID=449393 RepID=A0A6J7SGB4_9ZZZZ
MNFSASIAANRVAIAAISSEAEAGAGAAAVWASPTTAFPFIIIRGLPNLELGTANGNGMRGAGRNSSRNTFAGSGT